MLFSWLHQKSFSFHYLRVVNPPVEILYERLFLKLTERKFQHRICCRNVGERIKDRNREFTKLYVLKGFIMRNVSWRHHGNWKSFFCENNFNTWVEVFINVLSVESFWCCFIILKFLWKVVFLCEIHWRKS